MQSDVGACISLFFFVYTFLFRHTKECNRKCMDMSRLLMKNR